MTVVRYLDTPVDLFLELQETLDALQREVQLATLGGGDLGGAMVDGMVVQRAALVQVRSDLYDQAMAARDAGLRVVDLVADYPDDSVPAVLAITAAARQAEVAATEGILLATPPGPALQALQAWVFSEVERQLAGAEPTPFVDGRDQEGFLLHLLDCPATTMIEVLAVIDALHREVQVMGFDDEAGLTVDRSVHDTLVNDREHLEVPRNVIHDQAAAARAAGRETVDIMAPYRWNEVPRALAAATAIAEADEAARRGELLATPMADRHRHLWLWIVEELRRQVEGAPPSPYRPVPG